MQLCSGNQINFCHSYVFQRTKFLPKGCRNQHTVWSQTSRKFSLGKNKNNKRQWEYTGRLSIKTCHCKLTDHDYEPKDHEFGCTLFENLPPPIENVNTTPQTYCTDIMPIQIRGPQDNRITGYFNITGSRCILQMHHNITMHTFSMWKISSNMITCHINWSKVVIKPLKH